MMYVVIFVLLKLIMDLTVHKDKFKKLSLPKFFWKETAEGPKTNWFHANFPMFYDVWHLCTSLEIFVVCFLVSPDIYSVLYFILGSLIFNFLYTLFK